MDIPKLCLMIERLHSYGTDLIFVGGSSNIDSEFVDEFILTIKNVTDIPVIIFPGGLSSISRHADAILFMSLLNSLDPLWISWVQAKSAPLIKKIDIETIGTGYIIIDPGMKVGEVGHAKLIARDDEASASHFALAAQYFGMKLVFLDAGSGSPYHVPVDMIRAVKSTIVLPLIVGGGIRTAEAAKSVVAAGADIIVTGTQIEEDVSRIKPIIDAVKA